MYRVNYTIIPFFIALAFLWVAISEAGAISPNSLVIAYSDNMKESEALAHYYAEKRQVPFSNLVGVDVTVTEWMPCSEFQEKLIPPVRTLVDRVIEGGEIPALLLVYGIPLGVRPPVDDTEQKALTALADAKTREYTDLILSMSGEVRHLIDEGNTPAGQTTTTSKTQSLSDVLTSAGEIMKRGFEYLTKAKATKLEDENLRRISSLLIRLAGSSIAEKAFMREVSKEQPDKSGFLKGRELLKWHAIVKSELIERSFQGVVPENALETATAVRFVDGIVGELKFWQQVRGLYERGETSASVDSELTLLLAEPYQRARWLPNPFYDRYDNLPFISGIRGRTLMVGRLDAPTPEMAKRLVDDAVATEKVGLKGTFYIDARGSEKNGDPLGQYAWYDRHLVNLYDLLREKTSIEVVIDTKPELFAVGACPHAALYCGWYSLGKYINSFTWQRGSVGFHVASAEASTLRRKDSSVWCKRMLEEGICATLGPVGEPYLTSFPLPDHFFPLLMTGRLPLLEVYFRTMPFISWRQVLIGDPLYTPFMKNPAISFLQRPERPQEAEDDPR